MAIGAAFGLGPWTVDLVRQVLVDGATEISLSDAECGLLRYLAERGGAPVPRTELLTRVLGYAAHVESRALDQGLLRLRRKLEGHPSGARPLAVRRGVGVWLEGMRPSGGSPEPLAAPPGRAALALRVAAALATPGLQTLTGPSGIGKTALARAVCASVGGRWVDCAPHRTEAELVGAVAGALGVSPAEVEGQLARLPALVLDNFEQLEPAAAVRVDGWASRGRVLVTSITPLRVPAERVVPVPLLDGATARGVLRDQVERLGLSASEAHLDAVIGAVGGHPLALVLLAPVAGHAEHLGAAALLDVSSDRPTDPERHRTLRAAIDRALGFVPMEHRAALGHAARFRGPFRVDALAATADEPVATTSARLRVLVRAGLAEVEGDAHRLAPVVRLHAAAPDSAADARKVRFLLGLAEPVARVGRAAVAPYAADLVDALAAAAGPDRVALFDFAVLAGAPWSALHAAVERCGLLHEGHPDALYVRCLVGAFLGLRGLAEDAAAGLRALPGHTPRSRFATNGSGSRGDFGEVLAMAPADVTPEWADALASLADGYRDARVAPTLEAARERCRVRGWWHAATQLDATLAVHLFRGGDLAGAWALLRTLPLEDLGLPGRVARVVSGALTGAPAMARADTARLLASPTLAPAEEALLRATDAALAWLEGRVEDAVAAAGAALEVPVAGDVGGAAVLARLVLVKSGRLPRTGSPMIDEALAGGPPPRGIMAPLLSRLLSPRPLA